MTDSSQKFIARNRAPRVQIEYDVELYGSEKKVQLPFVMGVMSDLAGKSQVPQPAVQDRSFLEIDVDNFDERMRAMAPRAAFSVPNTLTGEGNIAIDLTFQGMDDFTPAAIAAKVDSLRPLLEARTQLSNLMAYMDGKAGAEALIEKILADPTLLSAVSGAANGSSDQDTALASLRALTPADIPQQDTTQDVLADLVAAAPIIEPENDVSDAVLAGLASQPVMDMTPEDTSAATLTALRDAAPAETAPDTTTQDALAALAENVPEQGDAPDITAQALDSLAEVEIPEAAADGTDDLLADLAASAPEAVPEADTTSDVLEGLAEVEIPESAADGTDDLLADLAAAAPEAASELDATADILDSLTEAETPQPEVDTSDDLDGGLDALQANADDGDDTELDDLLGDLGDGDDSGLDDLLSDDGDSGDAGLDDLLGDIGDGDDSDLDDLLGDDDVSDDTNLDDLLGELGENADSDAQDPVSESGDSDSSDLDALLGDLGGDEDGDLDALLASADDGEASELDDLLGELGDGDDSGLDDLLGDDGDGGNTDLDDLLDELDSGDTDLDDLLGDVAASQGTQPDAAVLDEPEFAYGQISAERPEPERLNRKRFRLAILGDFSGRAARGQLETGDALAARKPILLDPDTAEEVIEGFATDLVLPIGKDGAGVAVKLRGLDDLHPDELYENVDLFAELVGLRGQLASGATAENAARQLREWGEKHGKPVAPTRARSAGNTVPADCKLSDFQKLIGDTSATLTQASPLDELMARIVGPHIRAIPGADAMAMQGAVDQALSAAMRLVLHHPEFQSLEAQWRSIDLIARSVETDDTLDVILYDISAEEIAADLATSDDLAQSGFARLLTEEPLDEENGRGGYSALIGLYTFEETPPHAELLGRIARLAAHVDAPFFAAITPAFLDTEKKQRHPLVANAWDTLRAMPEAGHLGLVSPRFLLRRPYGAKSEPIYEFEFEEFTMAEGLKGMLWANPVVLVAILLARSFRENGASMGLGAIMSLGEMPYHYVNDRFGDQVALPCTERNLTLDKIEMAVTRGIMSVASIKGRDEIRLTSFGSLAGGEILGPWTGAPAPKPSPPKPEPAVAAPEMVDFEDSSGDDMDLDDLLADFGDDPDLGGPDLGDDDDDTDAELAALLDDL